MSITTVGALITALKKHDSALPVEALDEGSATRNFQAYKVTQVGEEQVGTVQTVFVRVVPKQ